MLSIMSNRVNLLMKHFPDIITLTRIPLSLSLLFFQHNSVAFIIIYSLCGLSDVLDGYVARKMNLQSVLGAKLDSISDFIMYMIIIIILCLWNWYDITPFVSALILITLIRGVNIGIIYCKFQQLGVVHTIGNKFVGLLVYSIPLLYLFTGSIDFLWIVLSITLLVSLEETVILFQMRELDLNRKSLFFQ